ncbi:ParB-like nuclease [Sulfitobacter noctilucae]|uniref:ParB/RepB/Spo0J family partition protein n=1 Tax=Sulfitobacter noctilucae TaxID=1342302 RepID=UPI000467F351|nr:ParB N-terminal domain-containing protein [Sulfitobacter noctilucae]KIN70123.1 ParB-like nuclease [Sulfitobacter noctilucae]
MAKRKRLTLPDEGNTVPARAPETKGMFTDAPTGVVPPSQRSRLAPKAPIADMAGAAAASAALEEVSAELSAARAEGRLVQNLRTTQIDTGHLMRDRVVIDGEDMKTLMASIRARGQQTPIEVLEVGPDRYGLISGWRRLAALARLYEETGDATFAYVHALVRQPAAAQDAYVAMVEENEIRVGLSYYERAQIVARTVQAGVYNSHKIALQTLFSSASRAKRSKIKSFLPVVEELGTVLHHPAAIGERLGLELSQRLGDTGFARKARKALEDNGGRRSAEDEHQTLSSLLKTGSKKSKKTDSHAGEELAPGIHLLRQKSGLTLTGPGVTDDLVERLRGFISKT